MALFLSKYVNKVDKKGRVSVPAAYRQALAGQEFHGIVIYRSHRYAALEGRSWEQMLELGNRHDSTDPFAEDDDFMATSIFADSVQLPFDGEGRIMLPKEMAEFAGIDEQAMFVGRGKTFQIWEPAAFGQYEADARQRAAARGRFQRGEAAE